LPTTVLIDSGPEGANLGRCDKISEAVTMATFHDLDDFQPKPTAAGTGKMRSVIIRSLIGMMAFVVICFGLLILWMILLFSGSDQTIKEVGEAETTERFANFLYSIKVCEPKIYHKKEYRKNGTLAAVIQLTRPIEGLRGIRGYTESGGWNGDGSDYYEVELSPELAAKLRATLPSSSFKPCAYFPTGGKYKPDWWPTQFPPGASCSEHQLVYLVLAPDGERAWLYVIRT